MIFTIEISHYPLIENYEGNIISFINELKNIDGVYVMTNAMSTQIKGEHTILLPAIGEIIAKFGNITSSTVLKIIPRDLPIESTDIEIS